MTRLSLTGRKFELRLEAEEGYYHDSRDDDGIFVYYDGDKYWWYGIGELINLETGERKIFRFSTTLFAVTSCPLESSILYFVNGYDYRRALQEEVVVTDWESLIDFQCNRILADLNSPSKEKDSVLPSSSILPI